MNKIILASSSPRRIDMMKSRGYDIDIKPAFIDETISHGTAPTDAVKLLALKKAKACEKAILSENPAETGTIIIGADTVVYKDQIMGKPKNRADAARMLRSIRGTYHYVTTGVAIIKAGTSFEKIFYDVTKVFCSDFSDEELNAYLDTDEPYDKAGAYAIQGVFKKYIQKFEGNFDTVVGFPIDLVENELKKL